MSDKQELALSADDIIDLLELAPLPVEGGMFRVHWRTEHGSAIYFLVTPDDVSAMHRLTGPELWHHYLGAPVQLVLLDPDGGVRRPVLGDGLTSGQRPVVAVDTGVWMGAYSLGPWSLLGTTMAPPYDPNGFEMGERDDLVREYPEAADEIARLTSVEHS